MCVDNIIKPDYNNRMIAYIFGTIKYKTDHSVIVLNNDIGYEVFVGTSLLAKLPLGTSAEFFVYHHIREDISALFGFEDHNSLELFKKLITVSGVGPKSAMNIMSSVTTDEIITSVQKNNPQLLTKVSGIGKKTAERLVLELKNKLDLLESKGSCVENEFGASDEIDALIALGYSVQEAREAMRLVSADIIKTSDRIKEALKQMGAR